MKLQYFKYFIGVAEHRSFSRAAERLHISQSALSRQVQILEREFGLTLFDRIGRRIVLTPAGQDLLARCKSIIHDVESVRARAGELAGGETGLLRIGATPQTLESLVSQFIPRFRRRFPDVSITITEDGSANLAEYVEQGQVDVAIGVLPPGSTLQARQLFPLGVLCVVPSSHRFKGRGALRIQDLKDEPLLLLRKQFMTRQLFDGACQLVNLRPRVVIESNSPHSLLSLVAVQLGIAIIPSTALLDKLRANAVPLRHDRKVLGYWMSAMWDPRRYRSLISRAFVDELHDFTKKDFPGSSFRFSDITSLPGPDDR
jgi:LysR family cyn operon transcriptional activator